MYNISLYCTVSVSVSNANIRAFYTYLEPSKLHNPYFVIHLHRVSLESTRINKHKLDSGSLEGGIVMPLGTEGT